MRMYPFPPPAGCEHEGISFSTTSRVWTWGCIPFHHQQGVNMRVYPFPPPAGCEHEGISLSTTSRVWTWGYILFHHQQGVNMRVYSFPPTAGCEHEGVFLSTTSRDGRESVSLSTVNNANGRVYPFPPAAGWEHKSVSLSAPSRDGRESVSPSTVNNVNVSVYPSPPPGVWTSGCFPFHSHQCGLEGVSLFTSNWGEVRWGCIPVYIVNSLDTGCFPFLLLQCGLEGVYTSLRRMQCGCPLSRVHPFSTASFVDLLFSIVCSVDLQGVSISSANSVYPLPSYDAFKCQNHRLYGFRQYGTRMNKNADAASSPEPVWGNPVRYWNAPVPDWDAGCQKNANAGGICLNNDARSLDMVKGLKFK